ncbi:stimulated by retinoic acid gene 6 protein-like isoform X2 [Actinia tenebrosa]|nr:stimulated by retinoic acid gene 6 protein-like isoform X2 [Actinia tenebrosa]
MGPAVVIIIVLMFMKRRTKRTKCCDGRPGIQPPVDFLGSEENRFSFALAYGAMAVTVTGLFANKLLSSNTGVVFTIEGPPWISVFQGIVSVISIGTMYLPLFLCLSTDAKILGSVMGFLFTGYRLAVLIIVVLRCPIDRTTAFIYWPVFFDLPTILSHIFLIIRFLTIFFLELKKECNRNETSYTVLLGEETDFKIDPHYEAHVKTLLEGVRKSDTNKWYVKGRNFVYTPQPHFKYSVAMLSTVIVAGIIIYEFVILVGGVFVGLFINIKKSTVSSKEVIILLQGQETYDITIQIYDILIITFLVSSIVAALYTYFQMYRMLIAHRNHVIKLIKSDRRFLPRTLQPPESMVGMSLRFCGYQIAYFLWGFLIMMGILIVVVMAISVAILVLPEIMSPELKDLMIGLIIGLIPVVGMAIFVWLLQLLLAKFVFNDRSMKSKVVNINNRRCFLLLSFFFFFFNILVGLMSCVLRIVKGMVLGIMFIGRIDRPLIMKGFTNLDTAYVAYIGFLHLQVAHKHPVVLVFSHLLWQGMRRKQRQRMEEGLMVVAPASMENDVRNNIELKPAASGRPRVSASALNKWFIAVTVIRNPMLIFNRKGYLRNVILGMQNTIPISDQDGPSGNNELQNGHCQTDGKNNLTLIVQQV